VLLILIIICFTIATLYWAAEMATFAIQIRSVLVDNVGMSLSEKIALADAATAAPGLIESFVEYFIVS
jgi:hypothetical protein